MKDDCADESSDQDERIVLHGLVVCNHVVLATRLAIVPEEHEVVDDPSKRELHHEDKQTVHEISRQFTLSDGFPPVVLPVLNALNLDSILHEDVRDEGGCVEIQPQNIPILVLVNGVIQHILKVLLLKLDIVLFNEELNKILLLHQLLVVCILIISLLIDDKLLFLK